MSHASPSVNCLNKLKVSISVLVSARLVLFGIDPIESKINLQYGTDLHRKEVPERGLVRCIDP